MITEKNLTVESADKISALSLHRDAVNKLKDDLLVFGVEIEGVDVALTTSKTGNGGTRLWFKCPLCNKRCGVLRQHPISHSLGCASCLGLRYRSSTKKGMVEESVWVSGV